MPSSNVKTEKYSAGKVIQSPSKDQRKSSDPKSTVSKK